MWCFCTQGTEPDAKREGKGRIYSGAGVTVWDIQTLTVGITDYIFIFD